MKLDSAEDVRHDMDRRIDQFKVRVEYLDSELSNVKDQLCDLVALVANLKARLP